MDIRAALESGHSKALSERIARYIGDDAERFGSRILILDDDPAPAIRSRAGHAFERMMGGGE